MATVKQELYDPMVYDVMRERANRLEGEYLDLESRAADPAEKARWRQIIVDLLDYVDRVDARDEAAVRAASIEFSSRFAELERVRVAAG